MTGPSAPSHPTPGRAAHPSYNSKEVAVLIRTWAVLAAAAFAAVLVVAGCHGPVSAAVPRPYPNPAPATPAATAR